MVGWCSMGTFNDPCILYNPGLFSHLPIMFYEPALLYMILGEPLISLTVTNWCFLVIEYCVIYIYWVFVWLSWCSMYGNVWYMLVILGVHVDTYSIIFRTWSTWIVTTGMCINLNPDWESSWPGWIAQTPPAYSWVSWASTGGHVQHVRHKDLADDFVGLAA
jgi:hypothetical protein